MNILKNYLINGALILLYFGIISYAFLFNNGLGWLLFLFSSCYLLISFITLTTSLKALEITCEMPFYVYKNRKTAIDCQLSASVLSRLLPRIRVTFLEAVFPEKQELMLFSNKQTSFSVQWIPEKRGKNNHLDVQVTAYDLLGFFRKSRKKKLALPTTVLPAFQPDKAHLIFQLLVQQQLVTETDLQDFEIAGHRLYQTGDSFNRINWKLSAHAQEWLYREYETEKEHQYLLCFWGENQQYFEQSLDLYYSLQEIWPLKNHTKLLILGNLVSKTPAPEIMAQVQPEPLLDVSALTNETNKHILIFSSGDSQLLKKTLPLLKKKNSVSLLHFQEDDFFIQTPEKNIRLF
ncbi:MULTISPECIES: DUF58 domain-containing protein [unclassified Enterococcus]|jgi:uncharacterized protein (DUF58 family)|uniref:DUF58 domain-containing protein n=1 Tax=unclassified Enterococcus TaxID=2608891 RepID=UPI003D2BF11C